MSIKTLDELKAENEALDNQQANESASEAEENQNESAEVAQEETGEVAEPEGETGETEVEAWLLGDEEERDFSNEAKIRRKWKGRAKQIEEEKNAEIEALRAENEKLRNPQTQSAPQQDKMPRLSDYDYDEDKHEEAMAAWINRQSMQNQASAQKSYQAQQEEARVKQDIDNAVHAHYQRAAQVAEKAGITAESYQAADTKVRMAMEKLVPGQGDLATDQMIHMLGEGSEKVMYYLGKNDAKMAELGQLLKTNPLQFAMKMGELKAGFSSKKNTVSRAPSPAKKLNPDGGNKPTDAYKKRYDKAKNDQDAFNIRREAKQNGIDVSKW